MAKHVRIHKLADNKTECQDKHWTISLVEALHRVYKDVTELLRKKGQ